MQLAGITYHLYYPPGRVLVKQHGEGGSLFFIINGEVAVTTERYDPIIDGFVQKFQRTMGVGEMFGEVSLLHDVPRMATITTLSNV